METITDELTDTVLGYYDEGRMEEFWDVIDSLQALLEVKVVTCGEHI